MINDIFLRGRLAGVKKMNFSEDCEEQGEKDPGRERMEVLSSDRRLWVFCLLAKRKAENAPSKRNTAGITLRKLYTL